MQASETFRKLSQSLDHDEKRALLQKIQTNTVLQQDETITPATPPQEPLDIETQYDQLPWYKKIVFFILSLFTGKPKCDIFLNHLVVEIGREIDLTTPDMFDWHNTLLMPGLLRELVELKDAARFFSTALDSGILANYGMFLVYLGSFEMPEAHAQLQRMANPTLSFAGKQGLADIKVRQEALNEAEECMNSISAELRAAMYNNARSLFCLKELAFFLFDRLILGFQQGNHAYGTGQICPYNVAKTQLVALNNLLFSFKKMPSMTLLSSMYVFVMQNEHRGKDLDNETELQRFTSGAEKALFRIRNFVLRVPLTKIIRCAAKDVLYEPVELAGGEEWFAVYRDKWFAIITENFNEFIMARRRSELNTKLLEYFDGEELEHIENIRDSRHPEGVPVENGLMLSFLNSFHKKIYMGEMNKFLRSILIDGEFYKRENRIEFTEAYNELLKIDDVITGITRKLQEGGEWGKQWKQVNSEVQSVAIKHRKISLFMEEIETTVDKLIKTSKTSLESLENIISGILQPDGGGRYDTLSNMENLTVKGNEFLNGLHFALKNIKNAAHLLKSIEKLDTAN